MDTEQLWNLFCDTGDPVCWLYYKAMTRESVGTDTR